MPRAFDEKELMERVDNDWDFLAETVEMLANDGHALMVVFRRAAASGDADGVGCAAHTLKGMIPSPCSPTSHVGALAVEQIGKSGDLASVTPAVETRENALSALFDDLTGFVSTRA